MEDVVDVPDTGKTTSQYYPQEEEEEEEEEIFLDEDLEENSSFGKTVTFEYSLLEEEEEEAADANDHCMKVVSPCVAWAMVGTVTLFAGAYGIIVLLDTKLSTPLDMLLAFFCAVSGLACFCVMRYCSLLARRRGLRRKKRRHSIKMHRITPPSNPRTHKHDASLDSLSKLIQKTTNASANKNF